MIKFKNSSLSGGRVEDRGTAVVYETFWNNFFDFALIQLGGEKGGKGAGGAVIRGDI